MRCHRMQTFVGVGTKCPELPQPSTLHFPCTIPSMCCPLTLTLTRPLYEKHAPPPPALILPLPAQDSPPFPPPAEQRLQKQES